MITIILITEMIQTSRLADDIFVKNVAVGRPQAYLFASHFFL